MAKSVSLGASSAFWEVWLIQYEKIGAEGVFRVRTQIGERTGQRGDLTPTPGVEQNGSQNMYNQVSAKAVADVAKGLGKGGQKGKGGTKLASG